VRDDDHGRAKDTADVPAAGHQEEMEETETKQNDQALTLCDEQLITSGNYVCLCHSNCYRGCEDKRMKFSFRSQCILHRMPTDSIGFVCQLNEHVKLSSFNGLSENVLSTNYWYILS
jgi:hypothetical protein